jgi:hypothetical protein
VLVAVLRRLRQVVRAGQPTKPAAYRLKVDAVACHLPGKTARVAVCRGVVAVDPRLIPQDASASRVTA